MTLGSGFLRVIVSPSQIPRPAKSAAYQGGVDFNGVLDHQELVLDDAQDRDEDAAERAIQGNRPGGLRVRGLGQHA
jgi:hypothetical protein